MSFYMYDSAQISSVIKACFDIFSRKSYILRRRLLL